MVKMMHKWKNKIGYEKFLYYCIILVETVLIKHDLVKFDGLCPTKGNV